MLSSIGLRVTFLEGNTTPTLPPPTFPSGLGHGPSALLVEQGHRHFLQREALSHRMNE